MVTVNRVIWEKTTKTTISREKTQNKKIYVNIKYVQKLYVYAKMCTKLLRFIIRKPSKSVVTIMFGFVVSSYAPHQTRHSIARYFERWSDDEPTRV